MATLADKRRMVHRKVRYLVCAIVFMMYTIIDWTIELHSTEVMIFSKAKRSGICNLLKKHMSGRWKHHLTFYSETDQAHEMHSMRQTLFPLTENMLNQTSLQSMYLPEEMSWLRGNDLPEAKERTNISHSFSFGKSNCRHGGRPVNDFQRGISYVSHIGNQCGCGTTAFQPSHSYWQYQPNITTKAEGINYFQSPSLRLAKRFAQKNETVCFVGDSVEFQFYYAFKNNLHRAEMLNRHLANNQTILNISSQKYPTHFSTMGVKGGRSKGYRLDDKNWRLAQEIFETTVTFHEDGNSFVFKYLKHCQWAPWMYEYMESCNVMIMNLALHYPPFPLGNESSSLLNDTLAAVTYLTNFSASSINRTSVWRQALPQHFETPSGHYQEAIQPNKCVPLNDDYRKTSEHQEYVKVQEIAFLKLCRNEDGPCQKLLYNCSVNTKSTEFFTVFSYWLANDMVVEWSSVERQNPIVNGTILKWHLFDLFDVPMWHSANRDCTHFCYVPTLYESAFERLYLLLSST